MAVQPSSPVEAVEPRENLPLWWVPVHLDENVLLILLQPTKASEDCAVWGGTLSPSLILVTFPSDFRHPGERPVGRHDRQGEAAALVPEDGGGEPGATVRQLHQQLEGRAALQRHRAQAQVGRSPELRPAGSNMFWSTVALAPASPCVRRRWATSAHAAASVWWRSRP